MDVQALAEEYRHRTDDELLRLLFDQHDLTNEARIALRSEIAVRRIDDHRIEQFQMEERQAREQEKQEEESKNLQKIKYRYIHYGKADLDYDPETNLERYTTTFYYAILLFPFIPMGSYQVQKRRSWFGRITVLKKLPLNWEQVLKAWVVATGSLLVLIWGAGLVHHLMLIN